MSRADTTPASETRTAMPTWLVLLIATACAVVVANLYYSQPLIGEISASLGLPAQSAGLIVTLTQIGYGVGLLLVVPLGDLYENRTLVTVLLAAETVVLIAAALVTASQSSTPQENMRSAWR
ncbi:hypothetical protein [Rhodococcus opacus]|uniref:hypothetical protein n=1 Tax=Rhodococcus opacus TaxID=37919 RepID=UPI001F548520|nr:hypothetical protein [Rhodococcus opacus]